MEIELESFKYKLINVMLKVERKASTTSTCVDSLEKESWVRGGVGRGGAGRGDVGVGGRGDG